ncbi:MAG: glutathione S-transferase [Methylomonas sp.]|jgi:glutathione S-transferase|uniref:glutathione S-transferase n=1 Tax=Methylomonas sp. TaxID=418 RepID=UPI0025FB2F7B|nr:glutathione S-transferase [Methylomonas sp.]MCK9604912.1 glutathione S-transferase [Methylomonas sp.]
MTSFERQLPILYSFRRCPYAMRARLAITYANTPVELREVQLRNKPGALLTASSKGTVPVLVLPSGQVVDESLDIIQWAIQINDPDDWASCWESAGCQTLIQRNDGEFKYYLDRYKYADRYPDQSMEYYRQQGECFLGDLEQRLQQSTYLCGPGFSIADAAIAPFIRQFAAVEQDWFAHSEYHALRHWLRVFLDSTLFAGSMQHYQPWTADSPQQLFGRAESNRSNSPPKPLK